MDYRRLTVISKAILSMICIRIGTIEIFPSGFVTPFGVSLNILSRTRHRGLSIYIKKVEFVEVFPGGTSITTWIEGFGTWSVNSSSSWFNSGSIVNSRIFSFTECSEKIMGVILVGFPISSFRIRKVSKTSLGWFWKWVLICVFGSHIKQR